MAADSRLTLTIQRTPPGGQPHPVSFTSSDSARKLFLAPNNIGISTCGAADIGGVPIAGFVESFIVERLKDQSLTVEDVVEQLKLYMLAQTVRPGTVFHIAGITKTAAGLDQQLFQIDPASGPAVRLNAPNVQGANWNGEIDVLQRLLLDVGLAQGGGQPPIALPFFGVPFQFFTLQDAIDFAVFGIRSTIENIRFLNREKTVGGPIDVLVITPDGSKWIQQKQLAVVN